MNPIIYIEPTDDNPAGIQFVPNDVIRSLHQDTPDSGLSSAGTTVMGPVLAFLTKNGTIPLPPGTEGDGVTYEPPAPPAIHVADITERYSGTYEVGDKVIQDDCITVVDTDEDISGHYRPLADLNEGKLAFKHFRNTGTDAASDSIAWLTNMLGYGGPAFPGFVIFDANSNISRYSLQDEETPDLCDEWFDVANVASPTTIVTAGALLEYVGPNTDFGGVFLPDAPLDSDLPGVYRAFEEHQGKMGFCHFDDDNLNRYGAVWIIDLHALVPAVPSGGGWILRDSFTDYYYNLSDTPTPPSTGWLKVSDGSAGGITFEDMTKGRIFAGFVDEDDVLRVFNPNGADQRGKYNDLSDVESLIVWGGDDWRNPETSAIFNSGNVPVPYEGSPVLACTRKDEACELSWIPG